MEMKKLSPLLLFSLLLVASQSFAWDDICKVGGEAVSMTSVKFEEFYKSEMRNRLFEGKGTVRDVRKSGSNYVVKVDCGNHVNVNVIVSLGAEDLKVGQEVKFSGKCYYHRRKCLSAKKPSLFFELEDGMIH